VGLDIVELVMAVEAGFGVEIPDDAASRMVTPRHVVTFLQEALPVGVASSCLTQRAFYRLRERCEHHLKLRRRTLAPATPLAQVVDADARRGAWEAIGTDLGAERWPPPRSTGWWGRTVETGRPATLGEAARYAATWYPRAVKGRDAGWTRAEIERAAIGLIEAETGVDMSRHTLDSEFARDLNLD
jgi:acyl carrier protein